ncbi:MAG: orotidine-5'-phosphate decarboxylase [Actinobacteria bacterium]|nr:orotidine-5'-phosphate decarboxylase [Actinomycetota bacterium]MCG2808569.1 orotidine-5'-phosphate decarboxylase [Coriobacteriia bacterium]
MMTEMRERIIVALDTDAHTALALARTLQGKVEWLKVGMTLYYAEGPEIVTKLREMGFKIFVDLKLNDIPHQVEGAAREISRLGASMFTVHAAGGRAMMEAAVKGACESSQECGLDTPDVIAVTVLTSIHDDDLAAIGVGGSSAAQVERLAKLAREAGVQGVVCSPLEAARMRELLGLEALVVTPGVRPAGSDAGDQSRIATPAQAVAAGASHLVIGRPITGSDEPGAAVDRIVSEG